MKVRLARFKILLKPWFLMPIILLILVAFVFVGWRLTPRKAMNIAVLNKTVPATDERSNNDEETFYRKHLGFFWLLEQQRYVKKDTREFYDYKSDYYGPQLSDDYQVAGNRELTEAGRDIDLLYLNDVYGSEYYGYEYSELSKDDMGVVSYAHSTGATIIAEMEIYTSTKDETVEAELSRLCGITQTKWVGRYCYELQDFSDIPYWAPPMYEEYYGVEWQCTGPGILLVSEEGHIIVLEEQNDFKNKNLLTVTVNEDYRDEFSGVSNSVNFYNWFELIEIDAGTEEIASFEFNLNQEGMLKFADVSNTNVFAAVTRKNYDGGAPVYYFAGDFCDYVTRAKVNSFLWADSVFRLISYDRDGDVTNFYWNFYNPLVKKILADTYKETRTSDGEQAAGQAQTAENARIRNGRFELYDGENWNEIKLKGFNINAIEPGDSAYEYSRNIEYYSEIINIMAVNGVNVVRAYDLLPPEFYRALIENNTDGGANTIYLIQTITGPNDADIASAASGDGLEQLRGNIEKTVRAIHGEGAVAGYGSREGSVYFHDVSSYLISYVLDLGIDLGGASALRSANLSALASEKITSAQTAAERMAASLAEYFFDYHYENYGYYSPLGVAGDASAVSGVSWTELESAAYNLANLEVSDELTDYFYLAYSLMPSDAALLNNLEAYSYYNDGSGPLPYGGYLETFLATQNRKPVLIDAVGLSTATNLFEKDSSVYGLTETQQGEGVVRMLKAIDSAGCIGGLVADIDDCWAKVGDAQYPYTVPMTNSAMWRDVTDLSQTSGFVAVEAPEPDEVGLLLTDADRLREMRFFCSEEYLYLRATLDVEIDFDVESLFFGLDTYQRNDGEYLYSASYFENSLSGMEFLVAFESRNTAALYVSSAYNRNTGGYVTAEGYDATWDRALQLRYGNYANSDTHFYMTGSTIHVRIPWSALGFTDPSQKVVVNSPSGISGGQVETTSTNGIIFSTFIGDIATGDTLYVFPENKQATGYRTYMWNNWETVEYELRVKGSMTALAKYFNS